MFLVHKHIHIYMYMDTNIDHFTVCGVNISASFNYILQLKPFTANFANIQVVIMNNNVKPKILACH